MQQQPAWGWCHQTSNVLKLSHASPPPLPRQTTECRTAWWADSSVCPDFIDHSLNAFSRSDVIPFIKWYTFNTFMTMTNWQVTWGYWKEMGSEDSDPLCSVQPCSYTEPGGFRELVNEFLSYKWLWNEALFILKGGVKGEFFFVDSAVVWDVYGLDLIRIICSPNIPMVLRHQAGSATNLVRILRPPEPETE